MSLIHDAVLERAAISLQEFESKAKYSCVSLLSYKCTCNPYLRSMFANGDEYKEKGGEPRTDPWGTSKSSGRNGGKQRSIR